MVGSGKGECSDAFVVAGPPMNDCARLARILLNLANQRRNLARVLNRSTWSEQALGREAGRLSEIFVQHHTHARRRGEGGEKSLVETDSSDHIELAFSGGG